MGAHITRRSFGIATLDCQSDAAMLEMGFGQTPQSLELGPAERQQPLAHGKCHLGQEQIMGALVDGLMNRLLASM